MLRVVGRYRLEPLLPWPMPVEDPVPVAPVALGALPAATSRRPSSSAGSAFIAELSQKKDDIVFAVPRAKGRMVPV